MINVIKGTNMSLRAQRSNLLIARMRLLRRSASRNDMLSRPRINLCLRNQHSPRPSAAIFSSLENRHCQCNTIRVPDWNAPGRLTFYRTWLRGGASGTNSLLRLQRDDDNIMTPASGSPRAITHCQCVMRREENVPTRRPPPGPRSAGSRARSRRPGADRVTVPLTPRAIKQPIDSHN